MITSWFLEEIEKCSASDCSQIYRAILVHSIVYWKTDVLQVFCFALLLWLTSPKRVYKHFWEITEHGQNLFSWEKPYINFISRKHYTLAFVALTHVSYSEVYNHQLFSISINFTRKSCYSHRRKSSTIFLRKSCSNRLRNISKSSSLRSATFIKLYVDRQIIYKN